MFPVADAFSFEGGVHEFLSRVKNVALLFRGIMRN